MSTNNIKLLTPPARIGIIGGGQLGRMITQVAKRMGYVVHIIDPKHNAPAGQVADEQIVADFSDLEAIRELAKKTDVLTFEFEHIDVDVLTKLEEEGFKIYPSSTTLKKINDKYLQKILLQNSGIKVPNIILVKNYDQLLEFFKRFNQKIVIKSCFGGYDGKGNVVIDNEEMLAKTYESMCSERILAEEFIPYKKEVSIIYAKNAEETVVFPVAENIHKDSILIKSFVPAKIDSEEEIREIAKKVANVLGDYGVFCVELFIDQQDKVYVNEIAPRPHNTGHYSIEACITSQYEQLVRVITGMPLGSTKLKSPVVMYNLLGNNQVKGSYQINGLKELMKIEDSHFHLYGKPESDYLKKIGHITTLGSTLELAEKKALEAFHCIQIVADDK